VHHIGLELGEQAVVVRDRQHPEAVVVGGLLDAAGAGPQGVDVEAGVGLVEDGELRTQDRQLQGLVPLLLPARQVDVEGPVAESLVEPDALGLGDGGPEAVETHCRGKLWASTSSTDTPGTSMGYCIARNRPAWARRHVGSASRSTSSSSTLPPVTS
jgi:hypothetical protein